MNVLFRRLLAKLMNLENTKYSLNFYLGENYTQVAIDQDKILTESHGGTNGVCGAISVIGNVIRLSKTFCKANR